MPTMTKDDFLAQLKERAPADLAAEYLSSSTVAAFPDAAAYREFLGRAAATFTPTEHVAVAGSGNWQYSLHPEKAFKPFHAGSDIDLVIVSTQLFHDLWEEMRDLHRTRWYVLTHEERTRLRRNGENVYAGFVSHEWLPNRVAAKRLAVKRSLNALSDAAVGFRTVRAYFFRNFHEAVAYYERGFSKARRVVN